jgi:signal transduction histidine kinase
MARDIHDTLAQGFTGVIVQLERPRMRDCRLTGEVDAHVHSAGDIARRA